MHELQATFQKYSAMFAKGANLVACELYLPIVTEIDLKRYFN